MTLGIDVALPGMATRQAFFPRSTRSTRAPCIATYCAMSANAGAARGFVSRGVVRAFGGDLRARYEPRRKIFANVFLFHIAHKLRPLIFLRRDMNLRG